MPVLHKIAGVVVVCAVILGLALPGARRGRDAGAAAADSVTAAPNSHGPGAAKRGTPASGGVPASARPPGGAPPAASGGPAQATPAAVAAKANELGEVPVIMYHRILKKPELSLDRSTEQLRAELTRLAEEGYVPVTAAEFAAGRFDAVPAGRHPVVLTFDDSTPGHFGLDAQGNPRPDTAVGIIQEVARSHPGFRPVATFYLNDDLFAMGDQAAAGLKWLTGHGYEIGNHTVSHADLSTMSKKRVRDEIGGMEDEIVKLTGAHTATLAYPFGAAPGKRDWARREDGRYDFQAIFLAGWKPSESPFDEDFDRFAINRVRSEGRISENDCKKFCSTAWLDELEKHPEGRFTSDGDPGTVTFPKAGEARLGKGYRAQSRTY